MLTSRNIRPDRMLHWSRTPRRTFTKAHVRLLAFILLSNRSENELFIYSANHVVLQTLAVGGELNMTNRGLLQRVKGYSIVSMHRSTHTDSIASFLNLEAQVHTRVLSSAGYGPVKSRRSPPPLTPYCYEPHHATSSHSSWTTGAS